MMNAWPTQEAMTNIRRRARRFGTERLAYVLDSGEVFDSEWAVTVPEDRPVFRVQPSGRITMMSPEDIA